MSGPLHIPGQRVDICNGQIDTGLPTQRDCISVQIVCEVGGEPATVIGCFGVDVGVELLRDLMTAIIALSGIESADDIISLLMPKFCESPADVEKMAAGAEAAVEAMRNVKPMVRQ